MTNYNERLDEIIRELCHDFENRKVDSLQAQVDAKQALTTLIKELVAEARIDELEKFVNTTNRSLSVKKLRDRLSALKSQQEEV